MSRARPKKKRGFGPRNKGLEIFFVNEKVCFEKQRLQYRRCHRCVLSIWNTIICYMGRNNRFRLPFAAFLPHHLV